MKHVLCWMYVWELWVSERWMARKLHSFLQSLCWWMNSTAKIKRVHNTSCDWDSGLGQQKDDFFQFCLFFHAFDRMPSSNVVGSCAFPSIGSVESTVYFIHDCILHAPFLRISMDDCPSYKFSCSSNWWESINGYRRCTLWRNNSKSRTFVCRNPSILIVNSERDNIRPR